MRIISGVVPPGGWHYQQKLKSSPQRPQYQRIEAQTYELLLDAVFKFRLNNLESVPYGTATRELVAADIQFYVCGHWPNQCTGSKAELNAAAAGTAPPPGRPGYWRPINRIEDWLTLLGQRELKWVDQARAIERAQICTKCPLNQKWQTGCGPCNENTDRRAYLIRGTRTTGLEPSLRGCMAYGTLLELSVWLEENHSAPKRKPPQNCWRMTEALTAAS